MAAELTHTIRAERKRLADNGPQRSRTEGDFARVSLPDADCDVLRDLLAAEGARAVIEIGLAYGSSALSIGEALVSGGKTDVTHLIIDPYQDLFYNAGWDAIIAAGLGATSTLITQRSQLALPRLLTEHFVADAAFVDGSHTFHNVFVDLYFLRELVRPGGLVILDDCQWPSVATAARYFEANTGWQRHDIGRPTRLHALRLPDPPVEPRFEDFKRFDS